MATCRRLERVAVKSHLTSPHLGLGLFVSVLGALTGSGEARAQQADRVIHLWVDPKFGDDVNAWTYNPVPGAPSSFCGTSNAKVAHPLLELDPTQQNAPLLHAPMPFRTVRGALEYLRGTTNPNNPGGPRVGAIQPPEGEAPFGAGAFRSAYVIIHCLPGLYQ